MHAIKDGLRKYPSLFRLARDSYQTTKSLSRFRTHTRLICLSSKQLDAAWYEELRSSAEHHGIIEDLMAYTGFGPDKIRELILRSPRTHFESEFRWFDPRDPTELTWFYRCSVGYLFANAVHGYWKKLDMIEGGRVLDFGAGIGCNTIPLAKRGIAVDFLEIGRMQADFIRFRARRRGLSNVTEVLPYAGGRFDPINSITGTYDAVVAVDVLEHIPNYHVVLRHLLDRLKIGSLLFENSPFDETAGEIDIHVRASIPIAEAMVGMERIEPGVWRKAE